MQILLLAKKNPFPAHDGEAIAILQMANGFVHAGCAVTVLYMNTPKHHFEVEDIPEPLKAQITFIAVKVKSNVSPQGLVLSILQLKPYHVTRFYSEEYAQKLNELVVNNNFDFIQAEGLYLIQYFTELRKYTTAKLIYRSHNIEAEIWHNIASNSTNGLKKWYLQLQAKKLLHYEQHAHQLVDAIIPISTSDEQFYKRLKNKIPLYHAPTGVEIGESNYGKVPVSNNSLYFIGGLDWLPNVEGLNWFIENVFPAIQQQFPNVVLHIAGRNGSSEWLTINNKQIIYHGEVEDATQYASNKFICIVPLLSGSGMKIKIIEAMHLSKPVITTRKGATGMPDGTAEHIYIADDAGEFIEQIKMLLTNPEIGFRKGVDAQNFVAKNLNHNEIAARLLQFYQTLPKA